MTKSIYTRLNEVRKKIDYIKKDGLVGFGNNTYKAVTHDMVTAMVRTHLIEQGIILSTSVMPETIRVIEGQTAKGSFKLRFEAIFNVEFIDMENPESRHSVLIPAHADDSGDKAPGKAMSYAAKYAILKTFNIETGEDDESRMNNGPGYTPVQKTYFDAFLANKDAMGMYLFKGRVGDDTYANLFNSAPQGEKTAVKNACRELEAEGARQFADFLATVESDDMLGAVEIIQELDSTVSHMAMSVLEPDQRVTVNNALKEANK